jgi:hypothetical protein
VFVDDVCTVSAGGRCAAFISANTRKADTEAIAIINRRVITPSPR